MNLTNRQSEVLKCISDFIKEKGYSPCIRELGELLGLSSTSTVHKHLQTLVDKGYITYVSNMSRTIRVIKEV